LLGYENNIGSKTMTLSSGKKNKLTDEEWNEMVALKNAINDQPSAVIPEKMEQFTEYLVRSIREMGG
jgi:hypothetical protein